MDDEAQTTLESAANACDACCSALENLAEMGWPAKELTHVTLRRARAYADLLATEINVLVNEIGEPTGAVSAAARDAPETIEAIRHLLRVTGRKALVLSETCTDQRVHKSVCIVVGERPDGRLDFAVSDGPPGDRAYSDDFETLSEAWAEYERQIADKPHA